MSSIEANKALVRRYFDTFNAGKFEELEEILCFRSPSSSAQHARRDGSQLRSTTGSMIKSNALEKRRKFLRKLAMALECAA